MQKMARIAGLALMTALVGAPLWAQDDEQDEGEFAKISLDLKGAEVPGGGDADGSGKFTVEIDTGTGDFCYVLTARNLKGPKGGHIHNGSVGETGKSVIALQVTGADGDLCIAQEPKVLNAMLKSPANYYVDIESAEFPAGAVRAQLGSRVAEPPAPPQPVAEAPAAPEAPAAGDPSG